MNIVITPLGTVSPYCKGNMNCPGYLIEYKDNKILLDCGNGVTSLLDFPSVLNNLTVIITHYHHDHFGDLGILQYATKCYKNLGKIDKKVKIYLPKDEFESGKKSITENNDSFCLYEDIDENRSLLIDDLKISFYNNNSHTIPSYMVKIEKENLKMVYTSDIGICNLEPLIDFCKDSDLLICESSFLKIHSKAPTHLSAIEAANIAKKAKVKNLLLTHFWPEIDKNDYLKEAKEVFNNTDVAIENKKIILKR